MSISLRIFLFLLTIAQTALPSKNVDMCRLVSRLAAKVQPEDTKIDPDKLQEWVGAHHGDYRRVAEIVSEHINLVGRDEFFEAIDDGVKALQKKKIDPKDIVFVYTQGNSDKKPWKRSGP